MGLFGMITKDETDTKRTDQVMIQRYVKKMEDYTKSLDHFNEVVKKLENMITDYESKDHSQQVSNVNFVLDLKYLKEQGDQVSEKLMDVSEVQLRELKKQLDTCNCMIEELNRNIEQESESKSAIARMIHSNRRMLMALIICQILVIAGIMFNLLYTFGVIVL